MAKQVGNHEIYYVLRVRHGHGNESYSEDLPNGMVSYPWLGKSEARADAKSRGARAVFVDRQGEALRATPPHVDEPPKKSHAQIKREIDEVLAKPMAKGERRGGRRPGSGRKPGPQQPKLPRVGPTPLQAAVAEAGPTPLQAAVAEAGVYATPYFLGELGYRLPYINAAVRRGELAWTRDGALEVASRAG
jgi:hypothetical protein